MKWANTNLLLVCLFSISRAEVVVVVGGAAKTVESVIASRDSRMKALGMYILS